MKTHFIGLLLLLLALLSGACNETPEFPDPKFDSPVTREYVVRRDTADTFTLKCYMQVPNGIDRIEILNIGNDYEVMERLEQYRGLTELDFSYPIDLTGFDRDTLLGYIVKVYDVKQRTYNKAFQLEVKKMSVPEIHFLNGNQVAVTLPFVAIRASLETGMVPIRQIILKLDGQEKKRIEPERDTCAWELNNLILQGLREMRMYEVQLVLEDVQGRQAVATQKVYRVDKIEKPKKIRVSGNMEAEIELTYDEQERLQQIELLGQCVLELSYHETLDRIVKIEETEYGNYSDHMTYRFDYDENGLLTTAWESGYSSPMAENIEYTGSGANRQITSFISGASMIENIAYETGFTSGEMIYAEEWPATIRTVYPGIRLRMTGFEPVMLPTYLEQLPYPLLRTMRWSDLFHDLFTTKYVHSKTVSYINESQVAYTYTYSMDEKGRLSEWRRLYTDTDRIDYYQFVY